jgi:hypothetical protein
VNWKLGLVLGALAGGVAYVVVRRNKKAQADAALWAEATDPVVPAGS